MFNRSNYLSKDNAVIKYILEMPIKYILKPVNIHMLLGNIHLKETKEINMVKII